MIGKHRPKIVVLGSTGMLGFACFSAFDSRTEFETLGTSRQIEPGLALVKNLREIEDLIRTTRPDLVVNCIGTIKPYIKNDISTSIINAIQTNSLLPYEIAYMANKYNFRVIQIATDCVFSGTVGKYTEDIDHDASDVYGKTKSLGEVQDARVLNLRCSIIGREKFKKVSLMEWLLGQERHSTIRGFTNHKWNGISTFHFAQIIIGIATENIDLAGTFHVVPANSITKSELLVEIAKKYNRTDLEILEIDSDSAADRTLSTIFPGENSNFWACAGYESPPTISEMIEDSKHFYDYLLSK